MAHLSKSPRRNRIRLAKPLSEALNRSLCNYEKSAASAASRNRYSNVSAAVAIGAVGLGVLALPQLSEARIIYTPANQVVNGQVRGLNIDFNHDGIADAFIQVAYYCRSTYCFDSMFAEGLQQNQVMVTSQQQFASAAKLGRVIGSVAGDLFQHGRVMASCASWRTQFSTLGATSHGPWRDVRARYLGFKFERDGLIYYGWARMNVTVFPCDPVGTLTGYAFETIPGKLIRAGQERDPDEPISEPGGSSAIPEQQEGVDPQPASLGALAIGVGGLPVWRKKTN
jgi:hypothetical protein